MRGRGGQTSSLEGTDRRRVRGRIILYVHGHMHRRVLLAREKPSPGRENVPDVWQVLYEFITCGGDGVLRLIRGPSGFPVTKFIGRTRVLMTPTAPRHKGWGQTMINVGGGRSPSRGRGIEAAKSERGSGAIVVGAKRRHVTRRNLKKKNKKNVTGQKRHERANPP